MTTRLSPWEPLGSLGSLGYALEVVGFVRSLWVHWERPAGRRVCSGSLGSLGCVLGVVWFAGFLGVHPRGRPVRSESLG